MNFYISKDEPLTPDKIRTIISAFCTDNRVKMKKYQDYYEGRQDILRKVYADPNKPCNKIIKNYCNQITSNFQGYILGIPVTYQSEADITEIINILNYNDIEQTDNQFLKNALIYGVAYETYWIDEFGQQRFKVLDSKEVIPVYDDTLNEELLYIIRFYLKPTWDKNAPKQYIVEVYDKWEVTRYVADELYNVINTIGKMPHYFNQVPFTEFRLNDEKVSCFDQIMSLQNGYNELISSEIDDYQAFVDAYLCLYGVGIDEDDVASMRENRILQMNQEDKAEYLTKEVNDAQIQNMLDNIDKAIHTIANSPDFTDQNFSAQSGIALRYKLVGFENRSAGFVSNMKKALQKRIELLCEILNIKGIDTIWRDINIIFKRNLPEDTTETMTLVNGLRGLVSDETLLAQLNFINDPVLELEKRRDEAAANIDLYSFSTGKDSEEEVNEEE